MSIVIPHWSGTVLTVLPAGSAQPPREVAPTEPGGIALVPLHVAGTVQLLAEHARHYTDLSVVLPKPQRMVPVDTIYGL